MRLSFCSWLSVGLLTCGLAVVAVRAGEEPADDLRPLAPVSRPLFAGNHQFQMHINGSTQAFSADGKKLYLSGHTGLTFWDLTDPKATQPRTVNTRNLFFHNAAVSLSPDGKTAAGSSAMGGNQDMPIHFFDTATGKEIRQIENDQQILSLSFSPDGNLLAVGTYQTLELWDAVSGDEVRRFAVEPNTVYRLLTFSPDGKMLAAVHNPYRVPPDDPAVVIHLWETASGKPRGQIRLAPPLPASQDPRQYHLNRGINGLGFSVDGRFLAVSGNDSAIHLWDLRRGEEAMPLTGFEGNASALVFTPDGRELLAMGLKGSLFSWSTKDILQRNAQRLPSLDEAAFTALGEELSQADVFRAYHASRHLKADPERAVALLGDRVKPVPPGDSARIRKLVADLANADAGVRRKAMMELRNKHGEAVVGALRENPNRPRNAYGMTFEHKLIQLFNTPERARDLRAIPILEEIGTPAARRVLEKLAKGAAGVSLTTEAKAALERLTVAAKERPRQATEDQLWADLASEDAARAFRAMGGLSATPRQAVDLFQKRLKPVPVVEEKEIAALLANLEAEDFKTREQATQELEKVGEQALPMLKKALAAKPSLEARKRIERLVEQASTQTSAPLLRGLRAIEVLEHNGTAESRHVLVALAGGAPQARLTREAKASLQRLTP
jgi:hypothetical protein